MYRCRCACRGCYAWLGTASVGTAGEMLRSLLVLLAAVLGGLQAFAREHVGGSRTLVWGTALHHRSGAKLDNQLLPLLPPDWLVLNRRGNGSLASKLRRDSSSGLRLSDGHAPHLVNMVDAQRIFTAVAARADGRRVRRAGDGARGSEAARPPTCHQTPLMLVKIMQARYGFVNIQMLNHGFVEMTKSWICNVRSFPGVLEKTVFITTDQNSYDQLDCILPFYRNLWLQRFNHMKSHETNALIIRG